MLVLVSGTALAHGITALALPILSRIYTPADFGLLAVFSSLLAVVSVAACLRYELAIAIPESDVDAQHLLMLSLLCCFGLSAVLACVCAFAPDWVVGMLGQERLRPFLWLAPVGLLLAGCYSALQFWHVRQKQFARLARTRIAQSAGSAGTQISLGWLGLHPLGLLLGHVMNTGLACVALSGAVRQAWQQLSWPRLLDQARRFRRFPLYSTLEALANSAAIQVPVIMIAALAKPAEAGFLTMAMYVAQAPLSLIGTAIGQVFLSRAPGEHRNGTLGPFTVDILGGLFKAGAGPLLAAGILSPVLFGPVFGESWQRAGWLVAWMTPWFLLQFLAVPIALALHVTARLDAALRLQVAGLALRVGMVWAAAHWNAAWLSEAYAISGALFYLVYLLVILGSVGAQPRSVWAALKASSGLVLAWVGGASLLAYGAQRLLAISST